MSEPPNMSWIKHRKEYLENIKKFSTKGDRLERTTQLSYMHNAIHESVIGFAGWLNGWISIELTKKIKIQDKQAILLTDKELNELHKEFQDFALQFIELDIKLTALVEKKLHKKKKSKELEDAKDQIKMVV